MNNKNSTPMRSLRDLQQCSTVTTLTPALHGLCSHFGRVDKLSILTARHEGAQQAICFLRLDSAEKEQVLMKTLGVGRFGGEVVFVVDLKPTSFDAEFGPSSQWSDFDDIESLGETGALATSDRTPLDHMTSRPGNRAGHPANHPGL